MARPISGDARVRILGRKAKTAERSRGGMDYYQFDLQQPDRITANTVQYEPLFLYKAKKIICSKSHADCFIRAKGKNSAIDD